jgi:hypothetical protein
MRRGRLLIAGAAALLLAVLIGWQYRRDQLVRACLENGGVWHGPHSACRQHPLRPIIQRELQRS